MTVKDEEGPIDLSQDADADVKDPSILRQVDIPHRPPPSSSEGEYTKFEIPDDIRAQMDYYTYVSCGLFLIFRVLKDAPELPSSPRACRSSSTCTICLGESPLLIVD